MGTRQLLRYIYVIYMTTSLVRTTRYIVTRQLVCFLTFLLSSTDDSDTESDCTSSHYY